VIKAVNRRENTKKRRTCVKSLEDELADEELKDQNALETSGILET